MGQPHLDSDGNPFLDSAGMPLFIAGPLFFPIPIGITAWPLVRSPTWDTLVQQAYSGKTTTLARRGDATYEYTFDMNILRLAAPADYQAVFGFVNSLLGQFLTFYFDDVNDDFVTDEIFAEGDGSTTQFQISRMFGYASDAIQFFRGDAPIIKVNGITLTAGVDYMIDTFGIITFTVAPALQVPIAWTGGYYWLCRLSLDKFPLSEFVSRMAELKKFTFNTILL